MLTHRKLGMFAVILILLLSQKPSQAETLATSQDATSPDAASLDATELISIQRSIVYKTLESGKKLLSDVYLPSGDRRPRPTLLMIHGGAWFSGNKVHVAYHANYAAEQGYAVVAINYRLAPRYKFPAQLEDCRDALVWIAEQADEYGFDVDRIGVYGYSAGAQLACLVGMSKNGTDVDRANPGQADLSSDAPQVQAIVAGGAPCEFSWIPEDSEALAYWLGSSREARPDAYAAASPVEFVDTNDPPVFLFHGTSDRIVPLQSPKTMEASLSAAHVTNQLHLVDKASHMGAFLDVAAREQAIRFLNQHLRE